MKLLILTEGYPDPEGGKPQVYVHTRNLFYKKQGADMDVLSFSAKTSYTIDNVNVVSPEDFSKGKSDTRYDLLICHAPNLKHHYIFLRRWASRFPKIIFFFHGHEVLKMNRVYPKPYPYMRRHKPYDLCESWYDRIKLSVWRRYIERNYKKMEFIFVSNWMKSEFERWVHPNPECLSGRSHVTYNCAGEIFQTESFQFNTPKQYDFITIRGFMDISKYCVDIVNELAKSNPGLRFLLIGRGSFFKHYQKASNIEWMPRLLNQGETIGMLNSARCALMPTRCDAQGVMMCEMATFGMPVITSDIPVCHEALGSFHNVAYIDNDMRHADLSKISDDLESNYISGKITKYFDSETCRKEFDIIKRSAKPQ